MAAPTIPRSITAVRGPGGLNRTPTCTGPTSGPLRVRIEARQHGWRRAKLLRRLGEQRVNLLSVDQKSPDVALSERGSKIGGIKNTTLNTQTHPLRNEAQLNCVSLHPSLDCEEGWRAVKGQDERCLSAPPLTAFHPWRIRDEEINMKKPPRRP
jgi:hypothetical protein